MGICLDTVLLDVHNAATTAVGLTAATPATGDSLAIRSFSRTGYGRLLGMRLQGSGTRQARLLSPNFHDNVTGFTFQSAESPAEFLFPAEIAQELASADTLVAQMDAAASSDTVADLLVAYRDASNLSADLRSWADIKSAIIDYKSMEVDLTTSATIGQWTDTAVNTTETQLKADYSYAVLGFETNVALLNMGLKGPATSNLRICAPGATSTLDLTSYWIYMSERHGFPMIPVFKANDRASTYISAAANTASVAAKVYAILARLRQGA